MREAADTRYLFQRRLPRERFSEMGRKGAAAAWRTRPRAAVRVAAAPSVRLMLDTADRRRGAADAFARSMVELHRARDAAELAYWTKEEGAIRRALRWVAAANALADSCYDALIRCSEERHRAA